MTIKVGDRIPSASLKHMTADGMQTITTDQLFKGKKVVLFALPGAFTPTCSAKHVPGFLANHDKFKEKGVDEIWCISVNDPFVMGAWAKDQRSQGKIRMLADGSGKFTKALGLELDLTERGLGIRSKRYSMLVEDGVLKTADMKVIIAEIHRLAPGLFARRAVFLAEHARGTRQWTDG